jgi:hypothetical protein
MRTVLKSWIASANVPRNPFPLQNLPYGVYLAHHRRGHCCVAIGDELVDLTQMEAGGLVDLKMAIPGYGSARRCGSLKPQLRLEWRGQDGQSETEQPDHSASLGDSITSLTWIRFSVHTRLLLI